MTTGGYESSGRTLDELRPPERRPLAQKMHADDAAVVNEHLSGPLPLPDAAVQTAVADALVQLGEMPGWWTRSDFHAAALRLHDALVATGYRLVPEDDEDTVRVPRVALIELNAAVMDRKRDLVDAIEEFNDEVRS